MSKKQCAQIFSFQAEEKLRHREAQLSTIIIALTAQASNSDRTLAQRGENNPPVQKG